MSETTKKLKTRFYINDVNALYSTYGGRVEAHPIPPSMYQRLAYEAYAMLFSKGRTHQDIISGAALPNRMPPKAKPEKVAKTPKAPRLTAAEKAEHKAHLKALSKLSPAELHNIVTTIGA